MLCDLWRSCMHWLMSDMVYWEWHCSGKGWRERGEEREERERESKEKHYRRAWGRGKRRGQWLK